MLVPSDNKSELSKAFLELSEDKIHEIYASNLPDKRDTDKVKRTLERLKDAVEGSRCFKGQRIEVKAFGSVMNGFFVRKSSDLDVTVIFYDEKETDHMIL